MIEVLCHSIGVVERWSFEDIIDVILTRLPVGAKLCNWIAPPKAMPLSSPTILSVSLVKCSPISSPLGQHKKARFNTEHTVVNLSLKHESTVIVRV